MLQEKETLDNCQLAVILYWREKGNERPSDEPTLKCQRNPFIGALGIQEPVMPGEPLIEC